MKNYATRCLSPVLLLALLLAILAAPAIADGSTDTATGSKHTLDSDSDATITGHIDPDVSDVTIPSTLGGHPVMGAASSSA